MMRLSDSTRIVLVEGVAGVGKSTLISALIRQYVEASNPIRSFLHLTQAQTYHPLAPDEIGSSLTAEENLAHLERLWDLLAWLASTVSGEQRKMFLCAIDTLHLTHCFRPGLVSWSDVADFDGRLSDLGCRLIFLRASSETIWKRTIQSRRDNEFITRYCRKYGNSLESIHQYFVREQEGMLRVLEQSKMKRLILDADGRAADLARDAFDFWMN